MLFNNKNNPNDLAENSKADVYYQSARTTAVIAAALAIIIAGVMLITNFRVDQLQLQDSPALNELRSRLKDQPVDDTIAEQIRTVDLELRQYYFNQRQFLRQGGYLLLGAIIVFLISIKAAAEYQKKLPNPQQYNRDSGAVTREKRIANKGLVVLGIILAGSVLLLAITAPQIQPGVTSQQAQMVTGEEGREAITKAWATPEEIQANWPRFRGPGGQGISNYQDIPQNWDGPSGRAILWKSPVPLPGYNSPIVWQDKIFLTGATDKKREVYCYDANTGKLLWRQEVFTPQSMRAKAPSVSEDTGYAAPTMATDGKGVYAIFANGDAAGFDFAGKGLWMLNLGRPDSAYGYASSLAMYHNLLLIQYDQELDENDQPHSKLIALDSGSGKTVWQKSRSLPGSWTSPIVIETSGGPQIITCGNPWVIAYEPMTGEEIWRAECMGPDLAPSPIYAGGLVLTVQPWDKLSAIRPDGKGEVTASHIVWTAEDGLPDICSPLANDKLVFLLTTAGELTSYDLQNGQKVWEHELKGYFRASPSLVDGLIYLISENGETIIVEAGREYKEIARNELGEGVQASPAFRAGRMYIRGKNNLYGIGK